MPSLVLSRIGRRNPGSDNVMSHWLHSRCQQAGARHLAGHVSGAYGPASPCRVWTQPDREVRHGGRGSETDRAGFTWHSAHGSVAVQPSDCTGPKYSRISKGVLLRPTHASDTGLIGEAVLKMRNGARSSEWQMQKVYWARRTGTHTSVSRSPVVCDFRVVSVDLVGRQFGAADSRYQAAIACRCSCRHRAVCQYGPRCVTTAYSPPARSSTRIRPCAFTDGSTTKPAS